MIRMLTDEEPFLTKMIPAAGDISVYRAPWKSALTAKNPPAPLLGEQNEYVFKTLLGMSDEKIGEYIEKGIIN